MLYLPTFEQKIGGYANVVHVKFGWWPTVKIGRQEIMSVRSQNSFIDYFSRIAPETSPITGLAVVVAETLKNFQCSHCIKHMLLGSIILKENLDQKSFILKTQQENFCSLMFTEKRMAKIFNIIEQGEFTMTENIVDVKLLKKLYIEDIQVYNLYLNSEHLGIDVQKHEQIVDGFAVYVSKIGKVNFNGFLTTAKFTIPDLKNFNFDSHEKWLILPEIMQNSFSCDHNVNQQNFVKNLSEFSNMIPALIGTDNFHNFELKNEHMKHTLVYSILSSVYDVALPNLDQTNFFQVTGFRGKTSNANLKPVFMILDTNYRNFESVKERLGEKSTNILNRWSNEVDLLVLVMKPKTGPKTKIVDHMVACSSKDTS